MDYGLLAAFLSVFALSVYVTGLLYQKLDALKLAALATAFFFTGYAVVSGFYFWLDRFDFFCVLLTEGIGFAATAGILAVKRKSFSFQVEWRSRSAVIYAIILCALLISHAKNEFFGMGQDEGGYQTQAIAYASGYTERQFDFEEYQLLETEAQREEYQQARRALIGLYSYDASFPTLTEAGEKSPVSGIFHGIPTFPAILGLFARLFGLSAMQQVQSWFLAAALLMVLFTTENMQFQKGAQYLALSITAFSPIVQWVIKSALTEGFMILIFGWFVFCITDHESGVSKWLSAVPICAFSFWHVSAFTIMPLFVCIYVFLYEETKAKAYIYTGIAALLSFAYGSAMMMYTSATYTCFNVAQGLPFLEYDQILPAFFAAVLFCGLLFVNLDRIKAQKAYALFKKERIFAWLARAAMLICMAAILFFTVKIYRGLIPANHRLMLYSRGGGPSIRNLSIMIYIFGTGFLALPLCIAKVFRRPGKLLKDQDTFILAVMFFYCVFFMCAFLRRDVPYCYYYTRYLAPFLVICGLTAGAVLNEMSPRAISGICICTVILLLPYDFVLLKEKDDSRMEWSVLADIADCVDRSSAVVIAQEYTTFFTIPIKVMSGADVYPRSEDWQGQIQFLQEKYENIFLITSDEVETSPTNQEMYVYKNRFTTSEDLGKNLDWITGFPWGVQKSEKLVNVYRVYPFATEYDFSDEDVVCEGFYGIENDSFRWMGGENACLVAFLHQKDYCMIIRQAMPAPLQKLGRDSLKVEVSVNGHMLGEIVVTPENAQEDIQITIPSTYLLEGMNTIRFSGESWSPSEYGSGDKRELRFAVNQISFMETGLID